MDFQEFLSNSIKNSIIADYIDEVITKSNVKRDPSLSAVFGIAVYALYRLAKNYFDHKCGLNEAALRREMESELKKLLETGIPPKEALLILKQINKEITSLRQDHTALSTAIRLIGNKNSKV